MNRGEYCSHVNVAALMGCFGKLYWVEEAWRLSYRAIAL